MRSFSFCPKGKRKQQQKPQRTQEQTREERQERGQAKEANTRAKGQERGQERGQRRGKRKANTQKVFNPPNSSRVQKPHNPRKDLNPYKYTSATQTALKTPLEREIRHICKQRTNGRAVKRTKGVGSVHFC